MSLKKLNPLKLALVAKLPFFVFLVIEIFKSLYIISPSCLVDAILNSFFEILKISFSRFIYFDFKFLRKFFKNLSTI